MKADVRASAAYYSDIAKTCVVVDPDEERDLIRAWQTSRDVRARNRIVESHLRFVVRQAHRRTRDPEAVRDYIAAGNLGLLRAVDKFEWARVPYNRFLTYAGWWIMEEMSKQDFVLSSTVHVPAHRQKERRRSARAYRAAVQRLGPESEEVQSMDQGGPEVVEVGIDAARNKSAAMLASCDTFGDEGLRAALRLAVARLPAREQTVLNLFYGVKDDPRSLRQIARIMDICAERVRQIKINGMRLLRDELSDDAGQGLGEISHAPREPRPRPSRR